MRLSLIPAILFLFAAMLTPDRLPAQDSGLRIDGPTSSLGKIENATELSGTFDFTGNKLLYNLAGSNVQDAEPFNFRELPWNVQPHIPYHFDAEKLSDGVMLKNPRLELLAQWDGTQDTLANNAGYQKLKLALGKIPNDALWIPEQNRAEIVQATVAAVIDTSVNDPTHKKVVEFYYLQQKSYHGNRQIPFAVFEQARDTCLAACAIRRRGKAEPHGSGVLIGKNLVLTSKHNFAGAANTPVDCEVLFHFTEKDPGAAYAIANEYHSSKDLDYSLIELGAKTKPSNDKNFKLPTPPKLGSEPELEQNNGIYVAGHPGGKSLSVALNCQVVFPYRLEDQAALKHLIGWAILRMFSSPAEYAAHSPKFAKEVESFFTKHYKPNGVTGIYFRPADQPTIGADPDTKHGNSGSPAYDLERNAVIGIVRAGSPDDANFPAGATYANFEAIVPISQIVDDLDKSKPGWKKTFAVVYFSD